MSPKLMAMISHDSRPSSLMSLDSSLEEHFESAIENSALQNSLDAHSALEHPAVISIKSEILNSELTSTSSGKSTTSSSNSSTPLTMISPSKKSTLKVLADGKVMKVQKTRQRKILSCIYCHSKKIKCLRVQPVCNNCEKLGVECKYFINERVSRGGKESARLSDKEKESRGLNSTRDKNYTLNKKSKSRSSSIADEKENNDNINDNNIHNGNLNVDLNGNNIDGRSSFSSDDQDMELDLEKDSSPESHMMVSGTDSSATVTNASSLSDDKNGSVDGSVNGLGKRRSVNANSSHNSSNNNSGNGINSNNGANASVNSNGNISGAEFKTASPNTIIPDLSLNYLNLNFNLHNANPNDDASSNGIPNVTSKMPMISNSVLQTPIINSGSNNITNNYFNTNFLSQAPNITSLTGSTATTTGPATGPEDQYSFNLSSFTFAHQEGLIASNMPSVVNSPMTQPNAQPSLSQTNSTTNINSFFTRNLNNEEPTPRVDSPSGMAKNNKAKPQPNNPGLHNSLNAYSSNPATTMNYLYGTNTYYDNDHLLDDLLNHLPSGKERSFELIDRYINSVHLLLPIVVNLSDFLKEHERYWDLATGAASNNTSNSNNNNNANSNNSNHVNNKSSPESISSASSKGDDVDFNYLQFYTLYFPILYASTISEFEEYDNLLLNQDINRYLKAFNKICQYYNYPHGIKTIPLLLGNVIIQSTSPNPSTMEMSQIIRYAKFLQMHKDPLISLRINDWEVIKFRRLLWWVIFGLDALTSHNFCLPPVCKFEDFNVLMPEEEEPIFDKLGIIKEKKLNVSILSMNVKFKYDRILSELVYHLHNGLSSDITPNQINEIKGMIIDYFKYIHRSIFRMNQFYKLNPPTTVQEMNLINFIKNHSWSFVDRALMLLHKKILFGDNTVNDYGSDDGRGGKSRGKGAGELENLTKTRGGILSLSQYEDTFGRIQEANIIKNFNNSSISLLRFNQFENFSYENMHNNLIPSILHNLNDFLKYNDFIKFGKYNWYIKRTIPLDSIILMFILITVKLKYEFMTMNELCIYVKLINKALFILNRKWFKNEKYKRMLSLTNLTWEFLLKRYNIIELINQYNESTLSGGSSGGRVEFFDYQVTSYMNMNDLFNVMDVPQPMFNDLEFLEAAEEEQKKREMQHQKQHQLLHPHSNHRHHRRGSHESRNSSSPTHNSNGSSTSNKDKESKKDRADMFSNTLIHSSTLDTSRSHANNKLTIVNHNLSADRKTELIQLNEKIYYDLRNNFVDINDYCAFYSSLENILHELMDYIHKG